MAKSLNQIYGIARTTTYGQLDHVMILLATLNSVFEFQPIFEPNGNLAPEPVAKYHVQFMKRIKAKKVKDPNEVSTTNALAMLDQLSQVDWETQTVTTGIMRSIGLKVNNAKKFNIDSLGKGEAKVIADSANVEFLTRLEDMIELIVAKTPQENVGVIAHPDPTVPKDTPAWDALVNAAKKIMLQTDEFKGMTSKRQIVHFIHPFLADQIEREQGTVFYNEAPIYKTGLASKTSVQTVPTIDLPQMNSYDIPAAGDKKRQVLASISMDVEAILFKKDDIKQSVDQQIAIFRFFGIFFYAIQHVCMPNRIFINYMEVQDGQAPITPKVNE